MGSNEQIDVLVVGSGPSGLVLALSLLRNGITVRIIEKLPTSRVGQRGAAIMPRSMELFHILGLSPKILAKCVPTPPVSMYDLGGGLVPIKTFEMAPSVEPTPDCPYLNIVCLGQDSLERILRDEIASKYNTHVEYGTELMSFRQESNHVEATVLKNSKEEETTSYAWMVGTDGAKSVCRKLLGATFLGETSNADNIIVGDILAEGLNPHYWHMWGDPSTTLVSLRPTEIPGLFNFILAGETIDHTRLATDPAEIRHTFLNNIGAGGEVTFGEIMWNSTHRPNIRMVNRLGSGRVYLAGDSAHVHSFTGGQGMNTGIQDSFNLGWKLALVERRLAPESLLQTYAEERLPVIAELLSTTTALLNKTIKKKENPGSWRREGGLLQLGVNYRWSSIVVDEQRVESDDSDFSDEGDEGDDEGVSDSYGIRNGGELKAGDRAPDSPGLIDMNASNTAESLRLFDIFGSDHHTVLIFSDDCNQSARVFSCLDAYADGLIQTVLILRKEDRIPFSADDADFVLEDTREDAFDTYLLTEQCKIVIVRPDGVIGGIVRDADGVIDYFGGIFGQRAC